MTHERWLQLMTLCCCLLSNWLLSMGEHNSTLTLFLFCAGPLAFLFADVLGWLRLNRILANLAALLAVAKSVVDFFSQGVNNQLLVIGNLLIYLQLVLLFQQKHQRSYWQLLVLSLLQVVVAAAMNGNLQFGLLLVVYMAMALMLLCWQFTYFETAEILGGSTTTQTASRSTRETTTKFPPVAWLAADPSQFDGALATSQPWETAEQVNVRLRLREVLGPIAMMGLLSMMLSATVFYAVPRSSSTNWQGVRSINRPMTGFTKSITLDEMGKILESNALAMRMTLRDPEKPNEPYVVLGQPYVRGASLVVYDGKKGWSPGVKARSDHSGIMVVPIDSSNMTAVSPANRIDTRPLPVVPPNSGRPAIRQIFQLESTADDTLFTIYPGYRVPDTRADIYFDPIDTSLYRFQNDRFQSSNTYSYTLGTLGLENGRQHNIVPVRLESNTLFDIDDMKHRLQIELEECQQFDRQKFPRLSETADRVVRAARGDKPPLNRLNIIRALELHFFDPRNEYEYTLRIPRHPPGMDPIESFVAESKQGHCEYFASAMVMMLRSQGIPARLVVGFHGGELNTVGNYYSIRQRDAHAWVEAYLRPGDITAEGATEILGPQPRGGFPEGGWLRVDPTPGVRNEEIATSWKDHIEQLIDYLQFLWSDYMLDMNADRQRRRVYDPLTERVSDQFKQWFSREALVNLLTRLARTNERTARSIIMGLLTRFGPPLSPLVLIGLLFLFRRRLPRTLRWGLELVVQRWRTRQRRHSQVDFYERVEQALAVRGIYRDPAITPREFLRNCLPATDDEPHQALRPVLAELAEAFYRVRYGQVSLAGPEREQLEKAVKQVEEYALEAV